MKKMTICAGILLAVLVLAGVSGKQGVAMAGKKVNVVIDYGNNRPTRTIEAAVTPGETVLGLLQTVAAVETHPVDRYIFVTGIDGVQGKRGETAWYYTVDGAKADTLAAAKVLTDSVAQIRWSYQKDVCSCTVDTK